MTAAEYGRRRARGGAAVHSNACTLWDRDGVLAPEDFDHPGQAMARATTLLWWDRPWFVVRLEDGKMVAASWRPARAGGAA